MRGLKTTRRSWADPRQRQFPKRLAAAAPVISAAEAEAKAERNRADIAAFIESQTADFNAYVERVRAQKAGAGNTDLNHGNVEAAE